MKAAQSIADGNVPFGETMGSVLLDLLRGLAALVVLADHWRNALYVDYHELPAHRMLAALPYLLTSGGHQAVGVFFVLSGYLIGGTIFRAAKRGQWSWQSYLLHRLTRLWIVLFPGLLLCELWDRVGIHLGRAPLLYGGAHYNHLTWAVMPQLGAKIFAGNLMFVGGLRVPTLGSDSALWSLSFEFWFYVLFPAVFFLVLERRWAVRAVLLAVALAAAWVCGPVVLVSSPIWLLGVCLAASKSLPMLRPWVRWLIAGLYAPMFFLLSKVNLITGYISDLLLGLLTILLMVALLSARSKVNEEALFVRASRALGKFSFTLYVAHLPFLLLLMSLVGNDRRWVLNGHSVVMGLLILVLTIGYAWALAALTEFRTAPVRNWLERHLPWRAAS